MVTIAIEEGDYETIIKIGKRFRNDTIIQKQIEAIGIKIEEGENENEVQSENSNQLLNRIRTQIYYEKIEKNILEELKNSKEIEEYKKIIALLAVCEKSKKVNKAKELLKEYKGYIETCTKEQKKKINKILERIKSKKVNIFDMGYYDMILCWEQDEELEQEYERQKEEEKESKKKLSENIIKEKKDTETKRVQKTTGEEKEEKSTETSNKTIKREEFLESIKVERKQNSKIKEKNIRTEKKGPTIKEKRENIRKFIDEQRRIVYVRAQSQDVNIQSKAIKDWDGLENLLYKVLDENQNEEFIERLYNKVVKLRSRTGMEH